MTSSADRCLWSCSELLATPTPRYTGWMLIQHLRWALRLCHQTGPGSPGSLNITLKCYPPIQIRRTSIQVMGNRAAYVALYCTRDKASPPSTRSSTKNLRACCPYNKPLPNHKTIQRRECPFPIAIPPRFDFEIPNQPILGLAGRNRKLAVFEFRSWMPLRPYSGPTQALLRLSNWTLLTLVLQSSISNAKLARTIRSFSDDNRIKPCNWKSRQPTGWAAQVWTHQSLDRPGLYLCFLTPWLCASSQTNCSQLTEDNMGV